MFFVNSLQIYFRLDIIVSPTLLQSRNVDLISCEAGIAKRKSKI